jgi:hypothetical protein
MLSHLLVYRVALVQLAAMTGALLAWERGWIEYVYGTDTSRITLGITALFVIGWLWTMREIWVAGRMLDGQRLTGPMPADPAWRDKDMAKVEWLSSVSEWLVGLGLFGTVIGFSMSLGSIDEGSLASAGGVKTSVETLMGGMRVALNTTICGFVFGLWQEVNVRMLRTALTIYWSNRLGAVGR